MQTPTDIYFTAAKRILLYLKGTLHYDRHFMPIFIPSSLPLFVYTNADLG